MVYLENEEIIDRSKHHVFNTTNSTRLNYTERFFGFALKVTLGADFRVKNPTLGAKLYSIY